MDASGRERNKMTEETKERTRNGRAAQSKRRGERTTRKERGNRTEEAEEKKTRTPPGRQKTPGGKDKKREREQEEERKRIDLDKKEYDDIRRRDYGGNGWGRRATRQADRSPLLHRFDPPETRRLGKSEDREERIKYGCERTGSTFQPENGWNIADRQADGGERAEEIASHGQRLGWAAQGRFRQGTFHSNHDD